jgi:hypothetical protein
MLRVFRFAKSLSTIQQLDVALVQAFGFPARNGLTMFLPCHTVRGSWPGVRGANWGSGAYSKNSTPSRGVKEFRVASFPPFLQIERLNSSS